MFLDLRRANRLDEADRLQVYFARGPGRSSSVYIVLLTIVLIESASKNDSVGCHIVEFDCFDLGFGNLAAAVDFNLLVTF